MNIKCSEFNFAGRLFWIHDYKSSKVWPKVCGKGTNFVCLISRKLGHLFKVTLLIGMLYLNFVGCKPTGHSYFLQSYKKTFIYCR